MAQILYLVNVMDVKVKLILIFYPKKILHLLPWSIYCKVHDAPLELFQFAEEEITFDEGIFVAVATVDGVLTNR